MAAHGAIMEGRRDEEKAPDADPVRPRRVECELIANAVSVICDLGLVSGHRELNPTRTQAACVMVPVNTRGGPRNGGLRATNG